MSQYFVTDQQLYDKIELLTTELERSSEVLQERSIESEQWKIKCLTVEQRFNETQKDYNLVSNYIYDKLNLQYIDLLEHLKEKVIEVEETRSKLNRLQQITVKVTIFPYYKDLEQKINQLVAEISNQNQLIQSKVLEQDTNRQQTITKIEELQEERQKGFHFESYIKQIKSEKLQALHFLKLKSQELDQTNFLVEELQQYKLQCQTLQLDIENVRKNYKSLYEQHSQEVQIHNEQIATLRQVNSNNLIIMSEQYSQQILQEKAALDEEKHESVQTAIVQLENTVQMLEQIIETKDIEITKIKLFNTNENQEVQSIKNLELASQLLFLQDQIAKYEIQFQENLQIQEKNNISRIQGEEYANQMQIQYKEQLKILELFSQKYQQVNTALQQSEMKRIESDNLIKMGLIDSQSKSDFIAQLQSQLVDIRQYQIRIAELETSQQLSKNREFSFDQLKEKAKNESKTELIEADSKIKYLLSLLEQREKQIQEFVRKSTVVPLQQKKNILNLPQQEDIIDRRKSISQSEINQGLSNIFYHQVDRELSQGQSRF